MPCIHYYYWNGNSSSPPEEHCTHPDHDGLECEDCPDHLDLEDSESIYWDQKVHEVTEG